MENKNELQLRFDKMEKTKPKKRSIIGQVASTEFLKSIGNLVSATEKILEPTRPSWNGDLWAERKIQIKILNRSIDYMLEGFYTEADFYMDCCFVKKHCSTALLFSKYNHFKEELVETLDKYVEKVEKTPDANRSNIVKLLQLAEVKYATSLKDKSQVGKIEEVIKSKTDEDVLKSIVESLKDIMLEGLCRIEDEYNTRTDEINENHAGLVDLQYPLYEIIGRQNIIIELLKQHYPDIYQELENKTTLAGEKRAASTKGNAEVVPEFSSILSIRRRSESDQQENDEDVELKKLSMTT